MTRKENYKSISSVNTEVKFLNRILAKQIQQHIRRIIHHDQVGFILGIREEFNNKKSSNAINHINTMKGEKSTQLSQLMK